MGLIHRPFPRRRGATPALLRRHSSAPPALLLRAHSVPGKLPRYSILIDLSDVAPAKRQGAEPSRPRQPGMNYTDATLIKLADPATRAALFDGVALAQLA